MTHSTHNETPPLAGESASGQTSELDGGNHTTPRSGVQPLERRIPIARHGIAFLVASAPANVIALAFITHEQSVVPTLILSTDEAHALGAALIELADDLERDAGARAWSDRMMRELHSKSPSLATLYEQANGAPESYHSKP